MNAQTRTSLLINRREFLNLSWLASLGFFLIPVAGVTLLFAYPRFKEGEFGGRFVLGKVEEVFLDGTYILGPAPRSLDRFVVRLLDEAGNEMALTDEEGNAIASPNENWQVLVDTGDLIRGHPRGEKYPTSEESQA
jgi:cytochrome b6-f complex iron-sulfur subunit